MTPEQTLMEAPVQEKTEKPVVAKTEQKLDALEQCFNAVEDHLNGQTNTREFHVILRSYGFTPEAVNEAYGSSVNYDAAYVQACKDADKADLLL